MRLLRRSSTGEISFTEDLNERDLPKYAILSHTWGKDKDEVTYSDVLSGIGTSKAGVGSAKIRFCIEQTGRDGLEHFWSDTCCIDKSNHVELNTALNSMFRWFEKAEKCYVWRADVSASATDTKEWKHAFRNSRWFTRGWTLQELIAPSVVEFYSCSGVRLGDRHSLEALVHASTGIPVRALRKYSPSDFTISERQEWQQGRQTGKPEDMVYSLLGLLQVTLPAIYGIGKDEAQRRLDLEIAIKHKGVRHAEFGLNFELPGVLETPNFVARSEELSEMRASLMGDERRRFVVLHGLGGIGKTQLAIAYAVRHKDDYSAIFWIDATSEDSIKSSFVRVARQILRKYAIATGLVGLDLTKDVDEVVRGVHTWLSAESNDRWLLICDNYDNPRLSGNEDPAAADLQHYMPDAHQGRVIVTTRSSEVRLGQCIQVKKLAKLEDSLDILQHSSGRKDLASDEGAVRLAERLDGLPLALATAGAYLSQTGISFAEYLEHFEQSWAELQRLSPAVMAYENRENRTLFSTWQVSFEQVQRRNSTSAHLLRLWAYFDNRDLWFELLGHSSDSNPLWYKQLTWGKLGFNAIVRVLCDHGLVDASTSNQFGVESAGYRVHACVHSWMTSVLNERKSSELAELAISCVAARVPGRDVQKWSLMQRRLLNHAERSSMFLSAAEETYNMDWACHKLGNLCRDQGKLGEAEKMYRRALEGREKALGEDHTSTLSTVNNLGNLYSDQGKLEEAEEMYLRALGGYEKALGADHTSTLGSVINLCYLRIDQQRIEEAQACHARARKKYDKMTPPLQDHVDGLEKMIFQAVDASEVSSDEDPDGGVRL